MPPVIGSLGADQRMGVVDQVVLAVHRRNRLATALGFLAGGAVPVATYLEAHYDINHSGALYSQITTYLVLGGLVFSAKTVFAWAHRAFHDGWKAAGFVVLLEGVMIVSQVPVLPLVILAILVAVNGIATGCTLSLDRATATRAVRASARSAANVVALSTGQAPHSRARTSPRRVLTAGAAQARLVFESKSVTG